MTQLKVVVHAVHFNADSKLIEYVESKVNKLTTLYDHIIEAEVFLKLENSNTIENKIVEIKIGMPGNDLFAKKLSKTFEEACDLVIEALKRQIKKRKQKVWGV